MTAGVVVGLDLGGTKLAAAAYDATGTCVAEVRRPRPSHETGSAGVVDAIAAAVAGLERDAGPVTAAGVAVAALVTDRGHVLASTHLPLADVALGELLGRRLGIPVTVENDATAAAEAEAREGAAAGARLAVCVLLGTGIGGGLVIDGRAVRGAHGLSGELGHVPFVPDGRPCPCGQRGCWERYASGSALHEAAARRGSPAAGGDLAGAAAAGDAAARAAWDEVGGWLGGGLAGVVAALDPDVVVVGGGLVEAGELLLAPARAALRARLPLGAHRPAVRVVAGALGPDAGVRGAALLAGAAPRPVPEGVGRGLRGPGRPRASGRP